MSNEHAIKKSHKLHSANIYDEAYNKVKNLVLEKGGTITDFINNLILGYVDRDAFLAMYAPHVKQDFATEDAVYLKDDKMDRIAVVRLKIYPSTDLNNAGYYGYCETCDSDNCIHVRHSLASNSLLQLKPSGKMV